MECEFLKPLAESVARAGGRLLAVGGLVRDHWRGEPGRPRTAEDNPDWDMVVFGLELPAIAALAESEGSARLVGRRVMVDKEKVAAIVHLHLDGRLVEISPARRPGAAEAEFSPLAGLAEDARTRDFTVNAIYYDPLTGAFEDPLGGRDDLARRRLRLADPGSIMADPLRLMRAFSLISRLKLMPDLELLAEAARLRNLLVMVPADRFWPEWRKWALSADPALGLDFLEQSGLLNFWPGLAALPGTPQNELYHPEGDAWRHTVLVVETISRLELPPEADRLVLVLAGLLHDIGKPLVTVNQNGFWLSRGHAQAGAPLALDFLTSIRAPERVVRPVLKLVERHMDLAFTDISPKALRRLARKMAPESNLSECWALAVGDWNSRGPSLEPFPLTLNEFLEPLGGRTDGPAPLLMGRDLLENFPDLHPGPGLGRILKLVEDASDEGQVHDKAEALAWVAEWLKNQLKPV